MRLKKPHNSACKEVKTKGSQLVGGLAICCNELIYKTKKNSPKSRDSSLFFSFSGNQLHPLSVHSTCSHPVLDFDPVWFFSNMTKYENMTSSGCKWQKYVHTKFTVSALAHGGVLLCWKQAKCGLHREPGNHFYLHHNDSWSALSANTSHGNSLVDCTVIITHSDLLEALNLLTANN